MFDELVLFDIDYTLVKGSQAHKASFAEAFKKVYGIDTNIDIINHSGKSDQLIIAEVLKKKGLSEKKIKPKMNDCMKVMIDAFRRRIKNEEIIVLDGASKLLEELNKNHVLMGLVTGNLKPIAYGKLAKVGLNNYFKVGGFGSDSVDKSNLAKIATQRARDNYGFRSREVFMIGDAPFDIQAGKKAGAKTIGVLTGIYLKEDLEKEGADFVLDNLGDTNMLLKILEISKNP